MLYGEINHKDNPTNQKWERELQIDLSSEDWDNIYEHTHKGSINISAQENNFKLYSRWYRTPERIHIFNLHIPPLCWRCNFEVGTLLHIWWECSLIKPFWEQVHSLISRITMYTLDLSAAQFLLHHTTLPQSIYRKSLALHLINTAKQCVPLFWRKINPPKISDWLKRIDKIAEMEDLIHQANDNPIKFSKTWACWLHFRESSEFQTLLIDPPHRHTLGFNCSNS